MFFTFVRFFPFFINLVTAELRVWWDKCRGGHYTTCEETHGRWWSGPLACVSFGRFIKCVFDCQCCHYAFHKAERHVHESVVCGLKTNWKAFKDAFFATFRLFYPFNCAMRHSFFCAICPSSAGSCKVFKVGLVDFAASVIPYFTMEESFHMSVLRTASDVLIRYCTINLRRLNIVWSCEWTVLPGPRCNSLVFWTEP